MTALNSPAVARAQSPRGLDRMLIVAGEMLVGWGRRRAQTRLRAAIDTVRRERFIAEQARRRDVDRWRSGAVRF